jgi:hypothetical protein
VQAATLRGAIDRLLGRIRRYETCPSILRSAQCVQPAIKCDCGHFNAGWSGDFIIKIPGGV